MQPDNEDASQHNDYSNEKQYKWSHEYLYWLNYFFPNESPPSNRKIILGNEVGGLFGRYLSSRKISLRV
jgi:hypothetical protein